MSNMRPPDPNTLYPIAGVTRTCFLKNIITKLQIIVGDYTYYNDPVDRKRFDDETTDFLLNLAWWDWPMDKIATHLSAIVAGDLDALRKITDYVFIDNESIL